MIDKSDVCGIIVTYNPDEYSLFSIGKNIENLENIIVYDNSSDALRSEVLYDTVKSLELKHRTLPNKITYIRSSTNVGLSGAYNYCAKIAEMKNCKFIILFDQDSYYEMKTIDLLLDTYDELQSRFKIGALSMEYLQESRRIYDFLFDGRFKWRGFYYSEDVIEVRDLINSGMMISLCVFNSVSGYNESIFLDNADRNFTLRLRLEGYHLFKSKRSYLIHNFGESVPEGSLIHTFYRDPSRDYYIRDLLGCLPIAKKISNIDFLLISLLLFSKVTSALLKDRKRERLSYIFRGIKELRKNE